MATDTAAKARPVQLQLNNSGAWKTVARYDAGNDYHHEIALDAVGSLVSINPNFNWRIVTDDPHPVRLMAWDSQTNAWRTL